jgi:hypothetical protein
MVVTSDPCVESSLASRFAARLLAGSSISALGRQHSHGLALQSVAQQQHAEPDRRQDYRPTVCQHREPAEVGKPGISKPGGPSRLNAITPTCAYSRSWLESDPPCVAPYSVPSTLRGLPRRPVFSQSVPSWVLPHLMFVTSSFLARLTLTLILRIDSLYSS